MTGNDGQLWQLWWNGAWQKWNPLGKPSISNNPTAKLTTSPGAVGTSTWGYKRIDIFVRGADGALWQLYWNGGWKGWSSHSAQGLLIAKPTDLPGNPTQYGTYTYAPAVASWSNNRSMSSSSTRAMSRDRFISTASGAA